MTQFPSFLAYNDNDFKDANCAGLTLFTRIILRLDHLQNLYLIERLVVKASGIISPKLLDVSSEIISLTLRFWTDREKLSGMAVDTTWLLLCYAAPASGILCMELLKGSLAADAARNSYGSGQSTRSHLIQQLSLLVGFLDWVGSVDNLTGPNLEMCRRVKRAIQHALDQALNQVLPQGAAPSSLAMEWDHDLPFDANEFFNFDMLDTFDWLRPDGGI